MRYPYPCCDYLTYLTPTDESYDICPVCCWNDKPIPLGDENFVGGGNLVSLKKQERVFKLFGAC